MPAATLDGADAYWKDYVEKNPIFDPTSPAVPKVNPNRKSYQEHFTGGQAAPAATTSFATPEEAEAANLPPGTQITIGGRGAVVE
jgi:hypothetical protein